MTQPEGKSGLFHGVRLLPTRTGFILERPESAQLRRPVGLPSHANSEHFSSELGTFEVIAVKHYLGVVSVHRAIRNDRSRRLQPSASRKSGRSQRCGERFKSTRRRYARKLPVSATAACSMTPTTMTDTVNAWLGNISVLLGSAVPKSWNWRKTRPFRCRVRARSGSGCSPRGLASPIPSSVAADIGTSKGHCRSRQAMTL
jgi:hypothetical protein